MFDIAWTEATFHGDALDEKGDITKATHLNIFIRKTNSETTGPDVRRYLDGKVERKFMKGVRVWNNRWDIRIGCPSWVSFLEVRKALKQM